MRCAKNRNIKVIRAFDDFKEQIKPQDNDMYCSYHNLYGLKIRFHYVNAKENAQKTEKNQTPIIAGLI